MVLGEINFRKRNEIFFRFFVCGWKLDTWKLKENCFENIYILWQVTYSLFNVLFNLGRWFIVGVCIKNIKLWMSVWKILDVNLNWQFQRAICLSEFMIWGRCSGKATWPVCSTDKIVRLMRSKRETYIVQSIFGFDWLPISEVAMHIAYPCRLVRTSRDSRL